MKRIGTFFLSLTFVALLIAAWEMYSFVSGISRTVLPAPSDIFQVLVRNAPLFLAHAFQTLLEAMLGLALATALGLFVAVLLFLLPRIRTGIYPLLVLSQTIPLIALAPLLLIWFGFGLTPKILIVVIYCFFPIAVALTDGLARTPYAYTDLLLSMRASRTQLFRYVQFPSALPAFFSGLKIAATYAISAAIVGEFVGGFNGLGVYMLTAANSHAIDIVFGAVVVSALLAVLLLLLIVALERTVITWKRYESR